jgi:alpha-galactosidase
MEHRAWCLIVCAGMVAVVLPVYGASPSGDELSLAGTCFDRWFSDAVQPESGMLPSSLLVAGVPSGSAPEMWTRTLSPILEEGRLLRRSVTFTHREAGVSVRYEGVRYLDFPTVEWTAYYRNNGTEDSPLLQDLKTIDAVFSEFSGKSAVLYRNKGDNCTADSFQPLEEELAPGSSLPLANTGGRPTQTTFPYFNFKHESGGIIFSLSWAGQWSCVFSRSDDGALRIQGGQELTRFILHPGEEVRGPLVVLQFYNGSRRHGQNVWRQWMIAHNLPRPGGNLPALPMLNACSSHQFGEMINADTANQIFFLDHYLDRGMRLDHWWMDAGWYPCDGQWPKTGTWEVDEMRFPGGFKPITDHAHSRGVNIIVWFEPERVHEGTWLTENHPDWIFGGEKGGLLNLGNPEAREWLINHVDGLLTSQGIDLYRQDFNMDPLDFWRKNDAENRQGITEIRHVEGYFAYWDELRRRHPKLLIDSCASGGRRNDLETLRRAAPFLRSDYIMEPVGNQCHTWALSEWFPYYGTGSSKTDDYQIMSTLCPVFIACWDQRDETINWPRIKEIVDLWRECGKNYFGDFYPITPYSLENNCWMAWQWHRPDANTGFIQAFRRAENTEEQQRLLLQGLNPESRYKVTPLQQDAVYMEMSGKLLMEKGVPVTIKEKPGVVFLSYEQM